MTKFKVGDKIKFMDEIGGGVIVSVLKNGRYLVENEDGFDVEYREENLVLDNRSEKDYKLQGIEQNSAVRDKIASEDKQKKLEEFYRRTRSNDRIESPDEIEVDLHIENLIDTHKGMGNAQILNVQMANFKRELNVAMRKKIRKLIVIHGVGEGVLKAEIRKELNYHYPSMEYHDADYRKYGYGATEILIYTYVR